MNKTLKIFILTIFITCMAQDVLAYVPLFGDNHEWGYVEYGDNPVRNPADVPRYYRIGFSKDSGHEIDGIPYHTIGCYDSFLNYGQKALAYMREKEGKVYAYYPEAVDSDPTSYYPAQKEVLLYDFNMKEGESLSLDPRVAGEECVILKCIETGTVDTKSGARKYLRFDTNVNETTRRYMRYEYLVEGVGPIGNCNLVFPYRASNEGGGGGDRLQTDFLYLRELPGYGAGDDYFEQGELLYISSSFPVMGLHDPSVWCWRTKDPRLSAVRELQMTDAESRSIQMTTREDGLYIESRDKELTEVELFDVLGNKLAQFKPHSREFKLDVRAYDTKIVIVRACVATTSRTFKIMGQS